MSDFRDAVPVQVWLQLVDAVGYCCVIAFCFVVRYLALVLMFLYRKVVYILWSPTAYRCLIVPPLIKMLKVELILYLQVNFYRPYFFC